MSYCTHCRTETPCKECGEQTSGQSKTSSVSQQSPTISNGATKEPHAPGADRVPAAGHKIYVIEVLFPVCGWTISENGPQNAFDNFKQAKEHLEHHSALDYYHDHHYRVATYVREERHA